MSAGCKLFASSPLKNTLVLCTSFMLLFSAYNGSINLLSSLNIRDGLGMVSQAVYYSVAILGTATISSLCLKLIGVKRSIAFSILLYAPYIASNFYPTWYTFLSSAVVIGLARGPLWTSAMTYTSAMAERYSVSKPQSQYEAAVFFFLGLLGTFVGFTNVFGNLTSFLILRTDHGYGHQNTSHTVLETCGVNFCDSAAIQSGVIQQPGQDKVLILIGIYVGLILIAFLLSLVSLDNVEFSEVGTKKNLSVCELVAAPLRRFRKAQHWYLMPLTIFAGLQESFLVGDYTKAFVACRWGVHYIGLTMTIYGIPICMCTLIGWLVKLLDRVYIFVVACILQAGAIVLLWTWTPDTPKFVLYIIAAMWGLGTVVWQSQVQGLYGIIFSDAKVAAFSVQTGLQGMGYMIGFAISSRICTASKLWLLTAVLTLGMAGYAAAELTHRRFRTQTMAVNHNPGSMVKTISSSMDTNSDLPQNDTSKV